jgi:hypothetical protein
LSGIEEGIVIYKGGVPDAVYGSGINKYDLAGNRRGFAKNSTCSIPVALKKISESTADLVCPYYDIAIRNYVNIRPGQGFFLSDSDFPVTAQVTMKVSSGASSGGQVVLSGGEGEVQIEFKNASGAVIGGSLLKQGGSMSVGILPNTTQVTVKAQVALNNQTLGFKAGSTAFEMERPSALIESIGHAGQVQRKLLVTIPKYDPAKRTLTEFSGSFDSDGFLK